VGAHLLLQLAEKGNKVRALYREEKHLEKTRYLFKHYGKLALFQTINWIQGDILDIPSLEDAFANITRVYHCAALVSFDPRDEEKLRKTNIEGTANVVNCALAFNVQKLCYVSSIAALGDVKEGETVITEETEWNPESSHSDYALSKHGAEMEVWRGWQEGLQVVIVNPGVIFGYGFWNRGSGKIFDSLKKGQRYFTRGNIGIVAVEDVIQVMIALMASPVSGEKYTVVAENDTVEEVLGAIAEGMNRKKPKVYATPAMTSFAWRTDWLISRLLNRPRLFTRSMAAAAHTTETFDNSKVVSALGYTFTDMKTYLKELSATFISLPKE